MRVRWFAALPTESADDLVPQNGDEESASTMSWVCHQARLRQLALQGLSKWVL
jgi:hypothetical protein